MAVFQRPVSGLRAILRAHEVLATPPAGQRPLRLRAALHLGPSIAVSLNERLDYFGSTINAAARLEKFSRGGDVVLSQAVYDDPEIAEFLIDSFNQLQIEPFSEMLKGFEEECFALWRVGKMTG
jgi:class 3 adenylate cyclase